MRCVYDLVVIGGGPCGIAAVVEAKANGFRNVLLLETPYPPLRSLQS